MMALGLALFAGGMLVTGSSIQEARDGLWLLGPFAGSTEPLWEQWTMRAVTFADWSAVLDQGAGIATAVLVAVMACLFNVGGVELLLRTDLDSNKQLRAAGLVNVAPGVFGGTPRLPGPQLVGARTADGRRWTSGRPARCARSARTIVFGATLVGLIPKMIVAGVLVFVGLSFLVAWIVDVRKSLPVGEYLIVLAIVVTIATKGLLVGLVLGLVLAVVVFAVNYGRIDLVHEVAFGTTYRSNVDRPPGEREALLR